MVEPLRSLLIELANTTMAVLQTQTLSDHADLIDCFFSMLSQVMYAVSALLFISHHSGQVLKKQPWLFLHPPHPTELVMRAALSCLPMPEQHPVKSVAGFISALISVSREVEPLVGIVNSHGEQLFLQVSLVTSTVTACTSLYYYVIQL